MRQGTVKWFNITKGYGFITPDGGGKDVFVYKTAPEKAGLRTLVEGQKVEFEIAKDRGKESAVNIKLIDTNNNTSNNTDNNQSHRSE